MASQPKVKPPPIFPTTFRSLPHRPPALTAYINQLRLAAPEPSSSQSHADLQDLFF